MLRTWRLVMLMAGAVALWGFQPAAAPASFTFFAIGDTQINLAKWGAAGTEATIAAMNTLPGKPFPLGGVVDEPRGVLIAGDLVDDTAEPKNWAFYKTLFHPRGNAKLRFPVFEGAGNHDISTGAKFGDWSYIQTELIARNRERAAPVWVDANGYHYSWDWDQTHIVCLNIFPGREWRQVYDRDAPWNDPKAAIDFLKSDLAARVGTSGRPVIVYWHYGLRGWGLEKWWLPEDLARLKATLAPYNIALLLHGHEHRYERYTWEGYDVVMAPSPQFDPDRAKGEQEGRPKGFLVTRIGNGMLEMANWTPQGWDDPWKKSLAKR